MKHEKVSPDVPVVGFRNGKTLKDYLVRVTLLKTNETARNMWEENLFSL